VFHLNDLEIAPKSFVIISGGRGGERNAQSIDRRAHLCGQAIALFACFFVRESQTTARK